MTNADKGVYALRVSTFSFIAILKKTNMWNCRMNDSKVGPIFGILIHGSTVIAAIDVRARLYY